MDQISAGGRFPFPHRSGKCAPTDAYLLPIDQSFAEVPFEFAAVIKTLQ
jgi:hypothetical protein